MEDGGRGRGFISFLKMNVSSFQLLLVRFLTDRDLKNNHISIVLTLKSEKVQNTVQNLAHPQKIEKSSAFLFTFFMIFSEYVVSCVIKELSSSTFLKLNVK